MENHNRFTPKNGSQTKTSTNEVIHYHRNGWTDDHPVFLWLLCLSALPLTAHCHVGLITDRSIMKMDLEGAKPTHTWTDNTAQWQWNFVASLLVPLEYKQHKPSLLTINNHSQTWLTHNEPQLITTNNEYLTTISHHSSLLNHILSHHEPFPSVLGQSQHVLAIIHH